MKERLIGAAVLVVIGVWLIPWILDGPESLPDPELETPQLPAEQESAPVRTQTIDLDARRGASVRSAPTAVATPRAADGSDRTVPEVRAADSSAVRDVIEAPERVASRGESQASVAAPVAASAADPAAGDWAVQLGSFGEEANANRLADRVSTFGYQAEVSAHRASGRLMHRVRVGPQASRNQAEAVASSLSAHGFVAQVVTFD